MQNNMKRNIGTFALTMTGIGSIIGSGWLFGAWKAAKIAGPAAIYAWILGTILILLIGLTFAELGGMFPEAGGMVRYGQFSHGSFVGYLSGWANWIAIVSVIPVEAEASAQYMSSWPFAWAHTIFNGKELSTAGLLISAALVVVYFFVNYFTVQLFARVNTAITVFKFIIPGLVIIGLLVSGYNSDNFTQYGGFMPNGWSGVLTAVSISGIVFAFNGFQSPINMAGEAKNPKFSVPFGVVASILIAGVIYVLLQITFIGTITPDIIKSGWAHINLSSPFADLAFAWGLNWLVLLLFADAFISPSGTGITYTATTARMIYGLEQNGYFPKIFGTVDAKSGIPRPAMWFNLVVSFVFLFLFRGWGQLSSIISIATLISYMTGPISVMVFRRHSEHLKKPFRIKGMRIIAPLGFIAASMIYYWGAWPLTGKVMIIMIIGLPIYFFYQFKYNFKNFKRDFKAGAWMICHLLWMVFLSFIGSEKFGGLNIIPFGWDFLVIAISALVFYYWGVHSGWETDDIKKGNDEFLDNELA
ncbi:amino acid/polyamine/organocation transporter (APC superfamily) [Scopulibacillus darangshiensis]|uniref:Amino acid/polyamine/organocation transporter (APC superfamily) n=1 Tax=Scopulibacillus darangshiensis TaxID=442528 RepID=A0A4R2P4Z3_9BACL|nr:APC family permease [Scopulibacillus darangshiensis]TCP29258.1 amino acid/polyamine/organocation transporter (APC superfamily) [Scopulibacillus darangshiensis]